MSSLNNAYSLASPATLGTIKRFNKSFLEIPWAVVVNKIDLPEAQEKIKKENFNPPSPCFYISAKTGEGLEALKTRLNQKHKNSYA